MQKRSINGLYKKLRLSTRYIPQRSLTLKGILIMDNYKLYLYKLYLDKLRLYKFYLDKLCLYKLYDKLQSNLHSKNLRSNYAP